MTKLIRKNILEMHIILKLRIKLTAKDFSIFLPNV